MVGEDGKGYEKLIVDEHEKGRFEICHSLMPEFSLNITQTAVNTSQERHNFCITNTNGLMLSEENIRRLF
jgi:hypothetical protein